MATTTHLRLSATAAIIGFGAAATAWVATYRETHPSLGALPAAPMPHYFSSPAWTAPVAVVIAIAAVGLAAIVLRRG